MTFKVGDKVQLKKGVTGWMRPESDGVFTAVEYSEGAWAGIRHKGLVSMHTLTMFEEDFELVETEVEQTQTTFKIGDKVRAVGGSRGWGNVDEGDEGVVTGFDESDGDIICSFPAQSRWFAQETDLELVEKVVQPETAPEKVVEKKVRRKKLANHLYAVVHKDSTNDIELLTSDRDEAREEKAFLGGKDAGYIILKYEAVKEIR